MHPNLSLHSGCPSLRSVGEKERCFKLDRSLKVCYYSALTFSRPGKRGYLFLISNDLKSNEGLPNISYRGRKKDSRYQVVRVLRIGNKTRFGFHSVESNLLNTLVCKVHRKKIRKIFASHTQSNPFVFFHLIFLVGMKF